MNKTTFYVKDLKYFHSKHLNGMSLNYELSFPTLVSAIDHTKFLMKYTEKPLKTFENNLVTFHCIEIKTKEI